VAPALIADGAPGTVFGVHAPVLHGETTTEALERWVGPHARWELGRQALVTDEMVAWICAPPEVELIDAETITWRAVRRYRGRWRDFDAFVPAPLRSEPGAELHLVGTATNGELTYLGPAQLAAYGRSGYESHGEAMFHLLGRLPREIWLRLGGFADVRVEASDVCENVEAAAVRTAVAEVLAASATGELRLRRWTGAALTVLFEPERAFVMELSGRGDVGSVAFDPVRSGERRPVAFTLRNGQVDEWPVESTVSRDQALDVVAGWAEGRRTESLLWTDDPPTVWEET
jgi:hypothetical protein